MTYDCMCAGFTGFGDMLKPTKSPTAIETERKTQSKIFAHSMRSVKLQQYLSVCISSAVGEVCMLFS